jgi:hypothetical protein
MTINLSFLRFGTGRHLTADYVEGLERSTHAWMVRSLMAVENLRNTEARLTKLVAERDALEQQVRTLKQAATVQPVRTILPITFPEHEELGRQPLVRVGTLWDLQGGQVLA